MAVTGPIKESRRLRIQISHRKRTIQRKQAELDALRADLTQLEGALDKVVKIESAARGESVSA